MAYMLVLLSTASLIIAAGSTVPTVEILQGPSSKTTVFGPDGSKLQSASPGGTLVTAAAKPGLVAARGAILPTSPEVVIGGGAVGKIITSYTLAGPAVVPAVPIVASPAVIDI